MLKKLLIALGILKDKNKKSPLINLIEELNSPENSTVKVIKKTVKKAPAKKKAPVKKKAKKKAK
jgi:hypothetical protein